MCASVIFNRFVRNESCFVWGKKANNLYTADFSDSLVEKLCRQLNSCNSTH